MFSMRVVVRDVNGNFLGYKDSKTFDTGAELDVWYQKNRWRPTDKKKKVSNGDGLKFKKDESEHLPFFSSDMVQKEKIVRKSKRKSEEQ